MEMVHIIVLLVFSIVWALFSAIFIGLFGKEKTINKLKYFDEDYSVKERIDSSKKSNKNGALKSLSSLVPSSKMDKKRTKRLETELLKADLPMTVSELIVIKMIVSIVLGFFGFFISRSWIIVATFASVAWNIPNIVIASKKKERVRAFDSQLNEGMTIISNSLKAGYSFLQALAVVTEEVPDPFAKEFKKLLKEMSLGLSEEEAFKNLINRMDSEDLKLIINAIVIQKDIGGNLSEILDNISETIRERQKIKNELKTLTAQGKLSGGIVGALPVFLGIVIFILNRDYVAVLFSTNLGLFMVISSVISQGIGYFMIRKIVDIKM